MKKVNKINLKHTRDMTKFETENRNFMEDLSQKVMGIVQRYIQSTYPVKE